MNTADKSIALLDIALRRRFEFVAMYPKYELENTDLEINDTEILKKLNKEIISRKGYDFTIGHSYFMGEDYKLKNTIDTKVIPLLLEYFMNDFEEVKKILQAAGLVIDGWPMKLVKND
jgi:5-methylcytosine-specific restriction endonuclease McrBC GTP-binding regulatory subunit McrB